MLGNTLRRFASNLKSFQKLEDMNKYLKVNKPCQYVVYFRANWNPQCQEADKHAAQLAASHGNLEVIQIDTDEAPKIANHYRVKAEPEFVFCLYGDEAVRQIGLNYNGLEDKIQKMDQLAQTEDLKLLDNVWVEYGQSYKSFYERHIR